MLIFNAGAYRPLHLLDKNKDINGDWRLWGEFLGSFKDYTTGILAYINEDQEF